MDNKIADDAAADLDSKKVEAIEVTATVVNCEKLNVRTGPLKTSDSVGILTKGDMVKIIDRGYGDWIKILYNNQPRYVMSKYITR